MKNITEVTVMDIAIIASYISSIITEERGKAFSHFNYQLFAIWSIEFYTFIVENELGYDIYSIDEWLHLTKMDLITEMQG